jgi:hypothetical protein
VAFSDLASVLEQQAFVVWQRLLEGRRSGFPPTEDGLSADILNSLQQLLPGDVAAERYSGSGEGGKKKPNADFELWITDGSQLVGLRLQAKMINSCLSSYPELNKKKALTQARRLIRNRFSAAPKHRESQQVYRFPFYLLYAASEVDVPFGNSGWRRSYGCSLVPAPTMLTRIRAGEYQLAELAPDMTPWAWPVAGDSLPFLEQKLSRLFGISRGGSSPEELCEALDEDLEDPLRALPPKEGAVVSLDSAPDYLQRLARQLDLNARIPSDLPPTVFPKEVEIVVLMRLRPSQAENFRP